MTHEKVIINITSAKGKLVTTNHMFYFHNSMHVCVNSSILVIIIIQYTYAYIYVCINSRNGAGYAFFIDESEVECHLSQFDRMKIHAHN